MKYLNKIKKILNENGTEGVTLYKDSLTQNDRVATGKTRDSIRYDSKVKNDKVVLTFYALNHIRDLETGQTPEQIQQNPPMFQQIEQWAIARGINRTANSIIRGLKMKGYEGTPNLITSVDKQIETNVANDLKNTLKSVILDEIKS